MLDREPYIDVVVGPQSYQSIPKILQRLNKRKEKLNFTNFDVVKKFDKLNQIKTQTQKYHLLLLFKRVVINFVIFVWFRIPGVQNIRDRL